MHAPDRSRFYRGTDKIVGGVCSGLADSLHVDAIWIRIVFVILAFVQGIGLLIYLALWVLMPENPNAPAQRRENLDVLRENVGRLAAREAGLWVGVVLIAAGVVLLAGNSGLVRWDVLWPVIVIGLGAVVLVRGIRLRR